MMRGQIGKKWSWVILIGSFFFISLALTDLGLSQKVPKKSPELVKQGKAIFEKACIYCHGPNGDGKGPLSTNLKTPPADFTKPLSQWKNTKGDPKKVFETIANGVPDTAMAKFHYTDDERWALAYTILEFSKEKSK
jgi:mono/diheme cytochrome c family protein